VNEFTCRICNKTCYSAAELENHVNKNCPYCGADMRKSAEDKCVMCGSYIPEGRMVCSVCEKDPFHVLRKEQDYEKG